MNEPLKLGVFSEALKQFKPFKWRGLRRMFAGLGLGAVELSEAGGEAAEQCWDELCAPRFADTVREHYKSAAQREEYEWVANRLVLHARVLFATALAAAALRAWHNGGGLEDVTLWCTRALDLLDPGRTQSSPAPPRQRFEGPATYEDLLSASLEALAPSAESGAVVSTWTLWRLGRLGAAPRPRRWTWFAWEYEGEFNASSILVADEGFPYPALVVHPEVALMPVKRDWLDTAGRAWDLSGYAGEGRSVTWRVDLRIDSRLRLAEPRDIAPGLGRRVGWQKDFKRKLPPLAGDSAGGAFYAVLACLRRGYRCVSRHALLAALPEPGEQSLKRVGLPTGKIGALPASVEKVALSRSQEDWDADGDRIERLDTLADAVEFMSGISGSVRVFLEVVARGDPDTRGEQYIEPALHGESSRDYSPEGAEAGLPRGTAGATGLSMTRLALTHNLLSAAGPRGVAVLGESGSGKSRLTWKVAEDVAADAVCVDNGGERWRADATPYIVLLLEGDEIARELPAERRKTADDDAALAALEQAALRRYKQHESAVRYIVRRAADEKGTAPVLLVVDGLDGVPAGLKQQLAAALRRIAGWPSCRVLLTSRPHEFDHAELGGIETYRLDGFTANQALRYIQAELAGEPARAEVVGGLLRSDPTFARLARVPLLLRLICGAAKKLGEMMPTRTMLYREFFRAQLSAGHDERGATRRLELMKQVGAKWLEAADASDDVETERLEEWVKQTGINACPADIKAHVAASLSPDMLAQVFLEYFNKEGLITQATTDGRLRRAAHPSFVEYLAGARLGDRLAGGEVSPAEAAGRAADPKWRGVVPFAAGTLANPLPLFEQLLLPPDPFHLRLLTAAACLAEVRCEEPFAPVAERIAGGLAALLHSPSKADRRSAIAAFGRMGGAWADLGRSALAPLLDAHDVEVCAAATEAACLIGGSEYVERASRYLDESWRPGRERILRGLRIVDERAAVAAAKRFLSDNNLALVAAAAETLAFLDGGGVEAIIELLRRGDAAVRQVACEALAASATLDTAVRLRALCGDKSAAVRAAAVEALAAVNDASREEVICRLENDPEWGVRLAVAEALGGGRGAEAPAVLRRLLDDENEHVVLAALAGLERAGMPLKEHLPRLLEHRYVSVRSKAAELLHRFDAGESLSRLVVAVLAGDAEERTYALGALAALRDPASVDQLLEAFGKAEPLRQREIADAFGRIGDARTVGALIPLLCSRESSMRLTAAVALGRIGDEAALNPLTDALTAGVQLQRRVGARERRVVARAIGMLKSPRALGPLLDCLRISDQRLNDVAASAIACSAGLTGLLAALDARGGAADFALKCPAPWIVYDLLHQFVSSADPAAWAGRAEEFDELTYAAGAARVPAAGTH